MSNTENKTHTETNGTQEQESGAKRENPLEQLLYLALGGVMAARERMERDSAQFREFQHQAQDNARELLDNLGSRGEKQKEEARAALRDLLREVIDDLGLATKEDLEQLKKDLER
jgi:polyhydroxyalkanoate synthesis regulator phasin